MPGLFICVSNTDSLTGILQELDIPFDRFAIGREVLWYDLNMDFDEGEVDGIIEDSNAGAHHRSLLRKVNESRSFSPTVFPRESPPTSSNPTNDPLGSHLL